MTPSAMTPLPVSVQTIYIDELVPVTKVSGEIDVYTGPVVQDAVTAAFALKPRLLVLDLDQVEFMGSTGIHLVVDNDERAHAQDSAFAVVVDQGYARRVLELAGVADLLHVYRDVPSALVALG